MKDRGTALVWAAVAIVCVVTQVGAIALGLTLGYFNTKGSGPKPHIVYKRERSPHPLPSPTPSRSAEAPLPSL